MGSCGGQNENRLSEFHYLNTQFPLGGAMWGGLGCVPLLEEVCVWELALRASGLILFQVCATCFGFVVKEASLASCSLCHALTFSDSVLPVTVKRMNQVLHRSNDEQMSIFVT